MNKVRCPVCQRDMGKASPAEWPEFPFCSPRCKTIDLGRWLGENYRIAADTEEEADATPEAEEDHSDANGR